MEKSDTQYKPNCISESIEISKCMHRAAQGGNCEYCGAIKACGPVSAHYLAFVCATGAVLSLMFYSDERSDERQSLGDFCQTKERTKWGLPLNARWVSLQSPYPELKCLLNRKQSQSWRRSGRMGQLWTVPRENPSSQQTACSD